MITRQATHRDAIAMAALALKSGKIKTSDLNKHVRKFKSNASKYEVTECKDGKVISFRVNKTFAPSRIAATSRLINNEKLNTRTEISDGVKYLVAPVVMVREQVLNGEYLPAEEIMKSVPGWNGRPVVVYHPKDVNGNDTSANQPDIAEHYEIGKLYNVNYDPDTTKLKGEIWIDISKVKKNKHTREAYNMIKNSDKLEVSTGYFVNDRVEEIGTFNGVEYIAVQHTILPDHLALLPNEIGACNWNDGAGVRNNRFRGKNKVPRHQISMNNYLSLNGTAISLYTLLSEQINEVYSNFSHIQDVIVDSESGVQYCVFAVYKDDKTDYESQMYKVSFIQDRFNSVNVGDDYEQVTPMMQYITTINREEPQMNKSKIVQAIIANSGGKIGRAQKRQLMALNEDQLIAMLANGGKKQAKKPATNRTKRTRRNNQKINANELVEMEPAEAEAEIDQLADAAEGGNDAAYEELVQIEAELVQDVADVEEVLAYVEETLDELDGSSMDDGMDDMGTNMDTEDLTDPGDTEDVLTDETELVDDLMNASSGRRSRRNSGRRSRRNANKTMRGNEDLEPLLDTIEGGLIDEVVTIDDSDIEEARNQRNNARIAIIRKLVSNKIVTRRDAKAMGGMSFNSLMTFAKNSGIDISSFNSVDYSIRGIQKPKTNTKNMNFTPMSINMFQPKGDK